MQIDKSTLIKIRQNKKECLFYLGALYTGAYDDRCAKTRVRLERREKDLPLEP